MLAVGTLFIFSSPSGGGKTSLINGVLEEIDNVLISVSHTTRPIRPGEENHQHYHFVSEEEFADLEAKGEFLESANVYGHFYGTSRKWVESKLISGNDVALDIDWQGARQIRDKFPNTTSIYILPPSKEVLIERLKSRAQDGDKVINERMGSLAEEVSHCSEYDYLIVNDVFQTSVKQVLKIIQASRLKIANQEIVYKSVISNLLKED